MASTPMRARLMMAAIGLSMAAAWSVAATTTAPNVAPTAAPNAVQVKAAHDMLAAMQAEKKLRMTAGMSKYPNPAQRELTMAKVAKVAPETVYTRLSVPVAKLVSTETALEMTRYYQSTYGRKVLEQTYNGPPQMYPTDPTPTAAEKAELKKPAFIKAQTEFKAAERAIGRETFLLLNEISKGK